MGAPGVNEPPATSAGATNRPGCLRKRILLVDDQPAVRDAIALLLSLDEHTVVKAADGAEALALFKPLAFDLVITDFKMPEMRGDELAARIKQVCPAQPVLMISAYAEQLGNAGNAADGLLDKPFRMEDLRQAMTGLLS